MKPHRPEMDTKWNSHTFIRYVFCFFETFDPNLTSKLAKSANSTTKKLFFCKTLIWVSLIAKYDAQFEVVEKMQKSLSEKS
jgi:hypothetical protein